MSRAEYNINRRLEGTGGHNRLNRVIDAERPYDSISMIFDGETPIQWACRVRIALQELCSWGGPRSTFHQYCLHATYTQGANFDKHNYSRGRLYEDGTAICFRCMKLMHVNVNLGPNVDPFDLMKEHYDHECSRPHTDFGHARLIQRVWRRFQEKELSNARLAWNSLPNDNTPDDKKFLTLIPHKIKNPVSLDQIKIRLNKEYAEYIKKYNRYPGNAEFEISWYRKYYIPDNNNWIYYKKRQLRSRFQKRLLEIEA